MSSDPARSGEPRLRLFVSYDREHDGDLYEQLVEHATREDSVFEITARSAVRSPDDFRDDVLRRAVQQADQVLVLCGEHSEASGRMGAELRIAQEEGRPYFLVWGRREIMCTRPTSARPDDSMYSWTWEILQRQMLTVQRLAGTEAPRVAAGRDEEASEG